MPSEAVDAGDAMARVRWVRVYSRIITDYTSTTTYGALRRIEQTSLSEGMARRHLAVRFSAPLSTAKRPEEYNTRSCIGHRNHLTAIRLPAPDIIKSVSWGK